MNAYREKQMANQAVYGANRIRAYCEYRKGKCHADGLPDCRFNVGGVNPWCCIMSFRKKPMEWALKDLWKCTD